MQLVHFWIDLDECATTCLLWPGLSFGKMVHIPSATAHCKLFNPLFQTNSSGKTSILKKAINSRDNAQTALTDNTWKKLNPNNKVYRTSLKLWENWSCEFLNSRKRPEAFHFQGWLSYLGMFNFLGGGWYTSAHYANTVYILPLKITLISIDNSYYSWED